MATDIDEGTLTFAAAQADAEVAAIAGQGTQRGEIHAVYVRNQLAEDITVEFLCTETLGDAEVECVLASSAVTAASAKAILVEGWLMGDSKIRVTPGSASAAGGEVNFRIRENG